MSNKTLKVKSADLLDSLKVLKPAIDSFSIVALHKHFHFLGDRIRAYSDKMDVLVPSPLGEEINGSVDADIFKAVSSLSKRAEEFDISVDGRSLRISTSGASYKFPFLRLDGVDSVGASSYEPVFSMDIDEEGVKTLGLASFAASQNDALMGVTCLSKDSDLFMASTNRQLLSVLRFKGVADKKFRFVVRPDVFDFVSSQGVPCKMELLGEDDGDQAKIAGIKFTSSKYEAYSYCLKLDPLDVPLVVSSILGDDIPSMDSIKTIGLPEDFWPSVKLATAVLSTKFDPIEIGIHNNHITVSTSSQKGTFTETFEIEDDGGLDVTVNISSENAMRAAKLSLPNIWLTDRATVLMDRPGQTDFVLFVANMSLGNSGNDEDEYVEEEVEA